MKKIIQDMLYPEEPIEPPSEEVILPTDLTEWIDGNHVPETLGDTLEVISKFHEGDTIQPNQGGRTLTITKVVAYREDSYRYYVDSETMGQQVMIKTIEQDYRKV
jgi:hypothetical protein